MGFVDLNLDAGESSEAMDSGLEEKLYRLVSSVNVACGGHAGDAASMSKAVDLAKKFGLRVGAHPSYPDREGFGRKPISISHGELVESLVGQIQSLRAVCAQKKVSLTHVKPHGALYNLAAFDQKLAAAFIEAVQEFSEKWTVVGLAGSPFLRWCEEAGMRTLSEGFTDRRYEADGTLRSRDKAGALITDSEECGRQAVRLFREGRAQTLCVHGDTTHALATATAVRAALESNGVSIGLA